MPVLGGAALSQCSKSPDPLPQPVPQAFIFVCLDWRCLPPVLFFTPHTLLDLIYYL